MGVADPIRATPTWNVLIKVALWGQALLLPWAVWVTVSLFNMQAFASQGDRFTRTQALQLQIELMERMDDRFEGLGDRISALPPVDWRKRIETSEVLGQANQSAISVIRSDIRTIQENQTRIIEALSRIEGKLGG